MPIEEGKKHQESPVQPQNTPPLPVTSNGNGFSVVPFPVSVTPVVFSMQGGHPLENTSALGHSDVTNNSSTMLVQPVPILHMPSSSTMVQQAAPLWLRLSLSSGQDQPAMSGGSAFQMMNNGDSISVA